jgi:hypothetical protein
MKGEVMAEKTEKPQSKAHYLVLEDLSYFNNGALVSVKKGVEDTFLDASLVPQEALNELIERELVKVINV